MKPQYDLETIKFGVDGGTWERAVGLYEKGKVKKFTEDFGGCEAVVLGTKPYQVSVSLNHYDRGYCNCYLGQQDTLCKHMIAVAIYAILRGKPIKESEKQPIEGPKCSQRSGELNKWQVNEIKKEISQAMRYIKSYTGPSKTWFAYQDSLAEGCKRLAAIVNKLPVGEPSAKLLVDLLLRLDKRVCSGGVDDSDGTVGGFMEQLVGVLQDYAKLDAGCVKSFKKLCDIETCFGWEEPLVKLFDEKITAFPGNPHY